MPERRIFFPCVLEGGSFPIPGFRRRRRSSSFVVVVVVSHRRVRRPWIARNARKMWVWGLRMHEMQGKCWFGGSERTKCKENAGLGARDVRNARKTQVWGLRMPGSLQGFTTPPGSAPQRFLVGCAPGLHRNLEWVRPGPSPHPHPLTPIRICGVIRSSIWYYMVVCSSL